MNKKGQALVEFILVLPIFLMLLLAVFDYVRIMETKMSLEAKIEDVTLSSFSLEDDITLRENIDDGVKTYYLSKNVDISSPILSAIISDKYKVEVSRSIYDK